MTGAERFWYVLQCIAFGAGCFAKVPVKKAFSEMTPAAAGGYVHNGSYSYDDDGDYGCDRGYEEPDHLHAACEPQEWDRQPPADQPRVLPQGRYHARHGGTRRRGY
jgi:hypothetical protein